jgi:PAS domain S-box-containing protein
VRRECAMTFSNLKISTKLLIVLVAFTASSIGVFGIIEYREAKEALRQQAFNQLTVVREMKGQQVEDYFATISNQILTFSESRTVLEAMQAFRETFKALKAKAMADHGAEKAADPELIAYYQNEYFVRLKPNTLDELDGMEVDDFIPKAPQARHFQELYLAENPNPTGKKDRLDDAGDGSAYSSAHKVYHPIIRSFLERFDYHDIFLIDPETGEIVYSVFKEVDYGTSLLTGPYKDTNLARVFHAARNSFARDFLILEDFEPYFPSYNSPASFIGSPVYDGDEKIGVLVFQMPIDRINDIMTSQQAWKKVGLGESGETYIVGDDFLMRNQSRFLLEDRENYLSMIRSIGVPGDTIRRIETFNSSIGLQKVETQGTRGAVSGNAKTEIFPDYRGVPVLSSYRPLRIPHVSWVILSEIDTAEAFAPVESFKTRMLLLAGLFLLLISGVSFVFAKKMTQPIKVLTAKAESLAKGDLGITIDTSGGDEISHLARSFDVMREALHELIEGLETKIAERTQELQDSEMRIRAIIENAADGIIVIGENGVIQSFSPAAEQFFGYTSDEVIGEKINMLMPEPMLSEHDGYLKRYFETGEKRIVGKSREVIALRKDETRFPIELAVGEVLLESERIFVGIIRDITERKIAEKELAHQLALIEALVDTLPNPVFVKDPETRYTILNKAFLDAFGCKRDDLIGKTITDLDPISTGLQKELQQEAEDLIRKGGMVHKESTLRFADGKDHDLLCWETAFKLSDGDIGGLVGIHVDITHQKELERQLSIANKRMGDELNIGRQIQMSMIPLTFPRFPEHKDIDVWAFIRPAREVGGDFYDFFFIDERLFAFVVADVSGKGVPAALLMAVAKTLLKSNSQDTQSTAKIVKRTNVELSINNDDCMFITAIFGIIDTKTGKLTYTNAGHNPPYIISPDGAVNSLTELHGPMIGVMEGASYDETEITLGVDDKLVLYTDGVTEAFNPNGELFDEERLSEFLIRSGKLGTKYLVDGLVQEIDGFAGEMEQSDDITVFCLRYVAWEVRDDRATIELHLINDKAEIDRCLMSLSEFCDRFDLPSEIRNNIAVVLDDLLNNIISYAFEDDEEHLIEVSLSTDQQRFIVTVSDDGVEFDPFLLEEPDIDSDISDRQVGGLGIHLTRSLMDDFSYRHIDGKNVTILMKRMGK